MYIKVLEQLFFWRLWEGHRHKEPMFMSNYPNDKPHTFIAWFMYMFSMGYINETVIPATNSAIEGMQVTLGDFFKYFGLWLLMEIFITSCDRISWFDNSYQPSVWEGGPFRLGHYLNGCHFEKINSVLRFTMREPPN